MICKAEGQTHLGSVSTLHEDVGVQLPGSEKELRTLLSTCCFRMLRLLSGIELQCNEQIRGPISAFRCCRQVDDLQSQGQTHLGAVSMLCENAGVQLLGAKRVADAAVYHAA